jgi:hypothetical protein
MTRYVDPQQAAIDRLRAEAELAAQIVEDLSNALEDSEKVCDRYRDALVHIDQLVTTEGNMHVLVGRIGSIVKDAIWTRRRDAA